MAGLSVDQILERLGRQKTAEEKLAEDLSEKPAGEVKAEVASAEETSKVEIAEEVKAATEIESKEEARTEAQIKLAEAEKVLAEAKAAVEAEESEKTIEAEKTAVEEIEKIKEAEETGAIMARAFHTELNKLAELELAEVKETETEIKEVKPEEDVELSKQAQVLVNLYTTVFGGTK